MIMVIRGSLELLDLRSRRIFYLLLAAQVLLAFLDLFGVLLIGLVAAIAAASVTGQNSILFADLLSRLNWSQTEDASALLWLALLAAGSLITKSITSFLLVKRSYRFLANRQAMVSSRLASGILSRPLLELQARTSQEVAYALTIGVNSATLGVLGGVVVIVAETAVLVVLAVGLLALDPTVALATVAFFGLIGIFMYKALGSRARRLGIVQTETEVASITSIQNALRSYREMSVSGRRPLVVDSFQNLRWRAASVQADLQIVGQITKYVFEVSLVVGGGFLVWSQFARGESGAAIAVVAVFLAAASRTMPSLLRVQQAAVGIRSAMGGAIPVLAIHEELAKSITVTEAYSEVLGRVVKGVNEDHGTFEPSIELSKVTLQYPGTERPAVSNVSLRVRPGQTLAIVGVTGSGKSTLADLILGVLIPASGSVHIGGLPPWETAKRWPGSMAYVPQEVTIVEGTVRSNVVLGIPDKMVADEWVWKSLQRAQLANLFRAESQGLDTQVGEHGVRLSGGQKQRLGLARALLTNPKVLVMDEATSALDAETEHVISQALTDLEGEVTMVIIAHRLATVRRCDQVAYIEDGQVTALGTFEEVRALVPRFDRQAELLGL